MSPHNLWVARPGELNPDKNGLLLSDQKAVDGRSLITGGQRVYWYQKKNRKEKQPSGSVSVRGYWRWEYWLARVDSPGLFGLKTSSSFMVFNTLGSFITLELLEMLITCYSL